jgi:hypothetical protein
MPVTPNTDPAVQARANYALPRLTPGTQPEPDNSFDPSASVATSLSGNNAVVVGQVREVDDTTEDDANKAILEVAHERFRGINSWENEWRHSAREELEFVDALKHWSEEMLHERKGRPCLTFDMIGPAVDQIVNRERQSPPEPQVAPVGGGASREEAEVIQGLFRNIENDSCAIIAYMTGLEQAVKVGKGWWRVHFEWENDTGFEQKITVRRIANLFSVYVDPSAIEYDLHDMEYAFVTEDIDKDEFDRLHPDSRTAGESDFSGVGDRMRDEWFPKGAVRVAEYFYIDKEDVEICMLAGGMIVPSDQVADGTVIARRTVTKRQIKWCKITGMEMLEQAEIPGKWIPLVPVLGKEIIRDGKRTFRGMIRPAMDANLSYDYMRSRQVEAIALGSTAQWLVGEGQLEGLEQTWADANRKAFAALEYKTHTPEGNPLPQPIPNRAEPAIQAITVATAHAKDDIQSMTSTYRPDLGAPESEASGRAILARQRQGDNAHFNYHDNLSRSLQHTARIMLDLTPHIYSEQRLITIYQPDGTTKQVAVNQQFMDEGVHRIFDLTQAPTRYNVVIGSGPGYATRRQEASAALMELTRTMPGPMSRAMDLLIRTLDIPDADELAARLRPPDLPSEDGAPNVQQLQAQIQQSQSMIQHLTEALNKAMDVKEVEKMKLASAERISNSRDSATISVAALKNRSAEAVAFLDAEIRFLQERMAALTASAEIDEAKTEAPQQSAAAA